MKKLNIVVMGTTDFAVPALISLINAGHQIKSVVCQPDRPNQRGKKIKYNAMKQKALDLDIPVFQPEKVREADSVSFLKTLDADFFVVAAYGQILSREVLDIPKYGCINIHGSLLPEYRGAAPIHHAIIDGKSETGVTIMQMDAGMDTGQMLKKGIIPITEKTTVGEMHDRLAMLGAELLPDVLDQIVEGTICPEIQNEDLATYADKVDKNTGKIDWKRSTDQIIRLVNGTDPFPGAWTNIDGDVVKCFGPEKIEGDYPDCEPGTIIAADTRNGLIIKTADSACRIGDIQVPGKRRMAAKDYFRGNVFEVGMKCGF